MVYIFFFWLKFCFYIGKLLVLLASFLQCMLYDIGSVPFDAMWFRLCLFFGGVSTLKLERVGNFC